MNSAMGSSSLCLSLANGLEGLLYLLLIVNQYLDWSADFPKVNMRNI